MNTHAYRLVLAVDTATVSGYSVRLDGRLVESGQVDTRRPGAVRSIVNGLAVRAVREGVPAYAVLERAYGGSRHVVEVLAMVRERWVSALRDAEVPAARVKIVYPNQWRAALFGRGATRLARDDIRALERATAARETGRSDLGDDEAAAICIGRWAVASGVFTLQQKRRKRRRAA